jgi:hypothetical protein
MRGGLLAASVAREGFVCVCVCACVWRNKQTREKNSAVEFSVELSESFLLCVCVCPVCSFVCLFVCLGKNTLI